MLVGNSGMSVKVYQSRLYKLYAVDILAFGSPSSGSGTAVLNFLLYFVFALTERKNEIQENEKYLAAAGYQPR
jgi:hypothetical protein